MDDQRMSDDNTPDELHVARPHPVGANGRPIRKDEIEIP